MFRGYYNEQARTQFITAALRSCFCEASLWRSIPRHNVGQDHPSDFSLVELRMENVTGCLTSLSAHPLVRSITPHRKLSHSLRCSSENPVIHSHRKMTLLHSVCVCVYILCTFTLLIVSSLIKRLVVGC